MVRLDDGRVVDVRPATANDVDGLAALYETLTPQDRYRRFFSGGTPSRDWIEAWATVGQRGGVALVAAVGDRIAGEAGYGPVHDGSAELGIAVAPDWRGWLGPYLLDQLVAVARDAGLTVIEAEVLSENRPMLRLLASRGDVMLPLDDFRTVRVAIPTTGRAPVWPPALDHPRILVEVCGGRWRGSAAAERAGVHVIACPRRPERCPALRGETCPAVTDADLVVLVPRHDEGGDDDALLAAHCDVHRGQRVVIDDGRVDVDAIVTEVQAAAR